jgi:hypothetical protein
VSSSTAEDLRERLAQSRGGEYNRRRTAELPVFSGYGAAPKSGDEASRTSAATVLPHPSDESSSREPAMKAPLMASPRSRAHASAPSVIMLVSFIAFLATDGTPGGLDGTQGFLVAAGATTVLLLALAWASSATSVPSSDHPSASRREVTR